tara:strand:- start:1040 stop:1195 length:156 start_codon:yes stop_codon:yes gene_type:complete
LIRKNKIPKYLRLLIKEYPQLKSGRKNYDEHNKRIVKTINLIKKYSKKTSN